MMKLDQPALQDSFRLASGVSYVRVHYDIYWMP